MNENEREEAAKRVQDQFNDLVAEGIRHSQHVAERVQQAGFDVPKDLGPMLYEVATHNISASMQVLQHLQRGAEALFRMVPTPRDECGYGLRPLIEAVTEEGKKATILRVLVQNRDARAVILEIEPPEAKAGIAQLLPGEETYVRMRVEVDAQVKRVEIKVRLKAAQGGEQVAEIVQPFEVIAGV